MTGKGIHVLGLSGGCSPSRFVPDQSREDWWAPSTSDVFHDAAAALVSDGRTVAAIEEERLNRIKHTNKLPRHSIQMALKMGALRSDDVTCFAYYGVEKDLDGELVSYILKRPKVREIWSARDYLAAALSYDLCANVEPKRVEFVEHHLAHAASAYFPGPFADALVVTLDGFGDRLSGTVWAGTAGKLERLLDIPWRDSLGMLYLETIRYLGYSLFDEYKAMGLAAYGNPETYRPLFDRICELLPEGRFTVRLDRVEALRNIIAPRRAGQPMTQAHRDLAAAVQSAVTQASLHLLKHYRHVTGLTHLCLAGGVALNSSMVGAVARSHLFDGVFVQPAAHDAGCALGAAIHVHRALDADVPISAMSHVYLGGDLPSPATVAEELAAWSGVIDAVRLPDIADTAASLLDGGAVLGCVQGRAEFGPRALGNRSILADPRPAVNKDRINELIKQREPYRPFAPAVLEEYAARFFEMPEGSCAAYMTFTVPVRPEVRRLLGAVTHEDGTARVQTVSRTTNPRFWELIEAFHRRTGVPVLLNTSFNHSVEPIVDSIEDAITCLLTTGLTHLIIDNYLITKRVQDQDRVFGLVPCLPEHVRLLCSHETSADGRTIDLYRCERMATPLVRRSLSPAAYTLLKRSENHFTFGELRPLGASPAELRILRDEIESLWSDRLLRLLPPAVAKRRRTFSIGQPAQDSVEVT